MKKYSKAILWALTFCLISCGGGGGEEIVNSPTTKNKVPNPSATRMNWSNASTWGGTMPNAQELVIIPNGVKMVLDTDVVTGGIKIENGGELEFARQDLTLTVPWILVKGKLSIGTADAPFTQQAKIVLNATNMNESIENMGTRGIIVMNGKVEFYGTPPNVAWTQINDHINVNAQTLKLKETVNWKIGDNIAIAPTEYYGHAETETGTISQVNGSQINLSNAINKFRWGKLQYVNSSGMTLTPTTSITPMVLDERAEVANLSRNIKIEAPNDNLWNNSQFGAQIMVMGRDSNLVLDGVELRRMGQQGKLGRYPIHFHLNSYNINDGSLLNDMTHVVKNSVIRESSQRCIVIHATNGTTIKNNICYDIKGHAIFLEDGVERRNKIDGNLVLKVRNPATALLLHELPGLFLGSGSSSFWLTNPDNIVINNAVADAQGFGFWLAFPEKPLGLSKLVNMYPNSLAFGTFDNNRTHSNRLHGFMLDTFPKDDQGNLGSGRYTSTTDNLPVQNNYSNAKRFEITKVTTFKNNAGGMWNRDNLPTYKNWISADNPGKFFAGAGFNGLVTDNLIVGTSLNDQLPYLPNQTTAPQISALASYHSTFTIQNNVIVKFPFSDPKGFIAPVNGNAFQGVVNSGAFASDDYYTRAVDKGLVRNIGNILINSHPGSRTPLPKDNWVLASALWDANGLWGPKNWYWVYDIPFLTYGNTVPCQAVAPAGKNGTSCIGPYYGVGTFYLDNAPVETRYVPHVPIEVKRTDNGATWSVERGDTSYMLGNMRHFAMIKGGSYILKFDDYDIKYKDSSGTTQTIPKKYSINPPKDVVLSVTNLLDSTDSAMIGIHYAGTVNNPKVESSTVGCNRAPGSFAQYRRYATAANSKQEVINSNGEKFWQDKANNLIWMKAQGGLPKFGSATDIDDPDSDVSLYEVTFLCITQS